MKVSIVMPARNEEGCLDETLETLVAALHAQHIPFEIIVTDDGSTDDTALKVNRLAAKYPEIRLVTNTGRHGFGMAVRVGLDHVTGEAIAVMMADGSDSPDDLVTYYRKLQEGYDCVFGSRFIRGGSTSGYPAHKLILNRMANRFIKFLFRLPYNDVTNAFKMYHRDVIEGMQPLISPQFNLTVEMPLKAIVRGYSYAIVPIQWTTRKAGVTKLRLKEMGSRYLFIVMYLWLEKHLSRGDYHRPASQERRTKTDHIHA